MATFVLHDSKLISVFLDIIHVKHAFLNRRENFQFFVCYMTDKRSPNFHIN
jgi:hypothetical protein